MKLSIAILTALAALVVSSPTEPKQQICSYKNQRCGHGNLDCCDDLKCVFVSSFVVTGIIKIYNCWRHTDVVLNSSHRLTTDPEIAIGVIINRGVEVYLAIVCSSPSEFKLGRLILE